MHVVLLIEDNSLVRRPMAIVLRNAGYGVIAVPDGVSALVRLGEVRPSVIVTDILMPVGTPRGDGVHLLPMLREAAPGVPIIAVTGVPERARQAGEAPPFGSGFDHILAKPLAPATLLGAVDHVLRRGGPGDRTI